jgi:hypothetical protein
MAAMNQILTQLKFQKSETFLAGVASVHCRARKHNQNKQNFICTVFPQNITNF